MALPFPIKKGKRRDQIVAIDLGSRITKAVHLQRRSVGFSILGYALQDAPPSDKGLTPEALSQHLTEVSQAVGTRCKNITFALGVGESVVRHTELPLVPVADMRVMLKYNSKNYLQQELPDHVYDCFILAAQTAAAPRPEAGKQQQKCKVLVGGARRQALDDLQTAASLAGLNTEQIVPGLIGPPNAFEVARPDVFAQEPVALVDIGFKNTSITLLLNGELVLSRVVAIGGDRLTGGVAESLGVSYAEAEGIKVGLPDEVQSTMVSLLAPLGRELRASIDFFEHQQDRTMSKVFVSGGSARSDYIIQILQTELMVACERWNPAGALTVAVPPQQMGELEQVAPQLSVAVGAALAAL